MKEIIELNKDMLREIGAVLPEEGLMLERNESPEELEAIPKKFREAIQDLQTKLNHTIPDDFGYFLYLGDREPDLMLHYDNGSMTTGGRGHSWMKSRSIFDQLRNLDWDEERKWAIQGSEQFDAIIAIAKELPVMVPRTKELQKHLAEPAKDYIKEKRRNASGVYALMWDGDQTLLDEHFSDVATFQRELPDIMTHMLHIVTVVSEGKPMPAGRIDRLKIAALKELEDMPISHAKASGKFAHIMQMASAAHGNEGEQQQ
jgi:hypothetical protein